MSGGMMAGLSSMKGAQPPMPGAQPPMNQALPQQPAPMFSNSMFNSAQTGFNNPMFNNSGGFMKSVFGAPRFNPGPQNYGQQPSQPAGMTSTMPGNVSYGAGPQQNPYMGGQMQAGYDDPAAGGGQQGAK